MANRPVFIPTKITDKHTCEVIVSDIDFKWFPGMSKSQKQKSIVSLHQAANRQDISHILEISSKSEIDLGVKLSAFNLTITTKKKKESFSVESAFQSSKVFDRGGPYTEILDSSSRQAKKDPRLKESGNLMYFSFFDKKFDLKPRTFFYDWIYINALKQNQDLAERLLEYSAFTDIEFNPKKSINCQAYSAALYVSLFQHNMLDNALKSPNNFKKILGTEYQNRDKVLPVQLKLF